MPIRLKTPIEGEYEHVVVIGPLAAAMDKGHERPTEALYSPGLKRALDGLYNPRHVPVIPLAPVVLSGGICMFARQPWRGEVTGAFYECEGTFYYATREQMGMDDAT